MATVRPQRRNVAPLRLSVERALALAPIVAAALMAAPTAAAESVRYCSASERADAASRKPTEIEPIVRGSVQSPRILHPPPNVVVRLFLTLTRGGEVDDVCVLESRPQEPLFEASAVKAVKQWRYAAADVAKLPPDRRLTLDIEFHYHDG